MWNFLERTVEIQISNSTRNVTLENPRTYFYSGHSSVPPSPAVPPGSCDTCQFSSPLSRGCCGVLVYEATTFTVAIFFSNPLVYNRFPMELGLELSLLKAHLGSLKDTYSRMSQMRASFTTNGTTACGHVTLDTCQEPVQDNVGVAPDSSGGKPVNRAAAEEAASGTESCRNSSQEPEEPDAI
ncbi:uncharacterized protein GJ701_017447 [Geothlypis trichas]